jgi:Holliday junction resolvase RusA-like endonuclease
MIRIVVDGSAVPYSERTRIGRSKSGKLAVWSYRPDKVQDYQTTVGWSARQAMVGQPPLAGPLAIAVTVFAQVPPSWSRKKRAAALSGELRPGRPDWDNLAKAIGDALTSIVFADDAQIAEAQISKRYDAKPRLEIEIHRIADAAAE